MTRQTLTFLLISLLSLSTTKLYAFQEDYISTLYGARSFLLHLPKNYQSHKTYPLIVALHGCLQGANSFAGGARLKEYADRHQAILIVPSQSMIANPYKCWNWFFPVNQDRSGEPALVVEMINKMKEQYKIDQRRVYAMGMSAGAGIANTLANCYPELFRAIGGHHGIQHKATENPMLAQDVFFRGPKIPAARAAEKGYQCQGGRPKSKLMPAITIQGDRGVMDSSNSRAVEAQFLAYNDLLHNGSLDDSLPLSQKTIKISSDEHYDYNVYQWLTPTGQRLVERIDIIGLGHSWSGGDAQYDWNDPKGPEATALIFDFFRHHGL